MNFDKYLVWKIEGKKSSYCYLLFHTFLLVIIFLKTIVLMEKYMFVIIYYRDQEKLHRNLPVLLWFTLKRSFQIHSEATVQAL
jgi:hypothetical protein